MSSNLYPIFIFILLLSMTILTVSTASSSPDLGAVPMKSMNCKGCIWIYVDLCGFTMIYVIYT